MKNPLREASVRESEVAKSSSLAFLPWRTVLVRSLHCLFVGSEEMALLILPSEILLIEHSAWQLICPVWRHSVLLQQFIEQQLVFLV
jgi:hypothetical protein